MDITSETVLLTLAVFCRIGGCLMVMPGFSSARVPPQMRLFLALSVSLALAPMIFTPVGDGRVPGTTNALFVLIFGETLLGVLIGLLGRMFFLALQFTASAIGMFIGHGAMPGVPVEDDEGATAITTFITMTATALFFISGLHVEVIRALLDSYTAVPMGTFPEAAKNLDLFSRVLSQAFVVALQISAPFLVYGLLVNLLFGLLNKMVPTIPAFFISVPFMIAGGLLLLYFALPTMMAVFMSGFTTWLARL